MPVDDDRRRERSLPTAASAAHGHVGADLHVVADAGSARPGSPGRRSRRCPAIPTMPQMMQFSPMTALWAICTWLSILVPRADARVAERAAVDGRAGADLDVVADDDRAERADAHRPCRCGLRLPSGLRTGMNAEAVAADDGVRRRSRTRSPRRTRSPIRAPEWMTQSRAERRAGADRGAGEDDRAGADRCCPDRRVASGADARRPRRFSRPPRRPRFVSMPARVHRARVEQARQDRQRHALVAGERRSAPCRPAAVAPASRPPRRPSMRASAAIASPTSAMARSAGPVASAGWTSRVTSSAASPVSVPEIAFATSPSFTQPRVSRRVPIAALHSATNARALSARRQGFVITPPVSGRGTPVVAGQVMRQAGEAARREVGEGLRLEEIRRPAKLRRRSSAACRSPRPAAASGTGCSRRRRRPPA